ncbi:glycosyl hydrolase family 5 [Caulobacter sp. X]|uniref:glycosyl hydrolase family 5 n=1 Tax=Caulobacter sp. X TaxID=2048901 RepID=UPI000C152E21|nr:glycosyl hydrolase family 5 [Caulobacter sp. X]PIC01234.1 glycosyl hydrolase family 5 [Caulobacter sp. X]
MIAFLALLAAAPVADRIVVDLSAGKPANTFRPDEAFGGGLDGTGRGEVATTYTPHNVAAMRQAGLKKISYRLRTELGGQAWHWNPEGRWSDPAHAQGYWTSDDKPGAPILLSHGYDLPRRGMTNDNANNNGYSRLDDGDDATFWKSNPYLDSRYTHAPARPQWLAARLDAAEEIDTARLVWATPYAIDYQVQYWTGADDWDPDGRWVTFPHGDIRGASGGVALLRLADAPIRTQMVRVVMSRGSNTAPEGSTDVRDRLGYAVAEVGFGRMEDGRFVDLVRKGRSRETQTMMRVSSTDPWHRAVDLNRDLEQPGLDLVVRSGLTNGLPMMLPVGALYDTPENAAALIRWYKRRGYPLKEVEIGEEADGQYNSPEDYAALYVQVARAVHAVDPHLVTGGPSLQAAPADMWASAAGEDRSWTRRFLRALDDQGRIADLGFFSFERYPFDDVCGRIDEKLLDHDAMLDRDLARLRADGVPADMPLVISEYGFSAYSGRVMSEIPAALLNADIVGRFLTKGGKQAFLFGYTPNQPINQHQACAGYGNMMTWQTDENGQAKWPSPTFQAARLLTSAWSQPGNGLHQVWPAASTVRDDKGRAPVAAYAVKRPDGQWALMLVNRDAQAAHAASLAFRDANGKERRLAGQVDVWRYDRTRYAWKDDGENSRPSLTLPALKTRQDGRRDVILPPWSLTVVRGRLAP